MTYRGATRPHAGHLPRGHPRPEPPARLRDSARARRTSTFNLSPHDHRCPSHARPLLTEHRVPERRAELAAFPRLRRMATKPANLQISPWRCAWSAARLRRRSRAGGLCAGAWLRAAGPLGLGAGRPRADIDRRARKIPSATVFQPGAIGNGPVVLYTGGALWREWHRGALDSACGVTPCRQQPVPGVRRAARKHYIHVLGEYIHH